MAIYKNSSRDGVWRVVVWADGKRHETTVRGDEAEAKRREVSLKMERMAKGAAKPQVNRKRFRLNAQRAEPWRAIIAASLEAHGHAPESGERLRPRSAFVPRRGQTSWLYAVQTCGAGGPVKFGRAYNVVGRMTQIQTGCPFDVVVLGVCSAGDVEGVIHDGLRAFHMRGEWYRGEGPVLAVAEAIRVDGEAEGAFVACGLRQPAREVAHG